MWKLPLRAGFNDPDVSGRPGGLGGDVPADAEGLGVNHVPRQWTAAHSVFASKSEPTDDGVAFNIALAGLPKVEAAVSDSCE